MCGRLLDETVGRATDRRRPVTCRRPRTACVTSPTLSIATADSAGRSSVISTSVSGVTFDSTFLFGPPGTGRLERIGQLLGLAGIVMLSIGAALGTALVNTGFGLLLLALLLRLPGLWPLLRREPLFWLMSVLCLYLVAETLLLSRSLASDITNPGAGLKDLLAISGLFTLVAAVGLGGDFRRMGLAAALMIFSLFLAVAAHSGPEELTAYLAGERATYGLNNNGPGVYMSLAILALICLWPNQPSAFAGRLTRVVWSAWIVGLLLTAVFLVAVIFNQSRSSWLAALVVFPVVLFLVVRRRLEGFPAHSRRKTLRALVLIGLASLVLVLTLGQEVVQQRLSEESHTIEQVARLQFDQLKLDSVGSRIFLWERALLSVSERPVLGWGPGASRQLIDEIPGISGSRIPHFHNLYLQITVETGVAGLLLFAAVFVALVAAAWQSRKAGLIPWGVGLFFAGAAVFFLIVSLVQIRHDDAHGAAFFALLTGLAYTRWLHRPIGSPHA